MIDINIFNRALKLYQTKHFNQSYKLFKELYKINQDSYEICFNLGLVCFELKYYKEALEFYKRSYKLSQHTNILVNIGDLFEKTSKYQKALKYYKKVLSLEENNLFALINIALVYRRIGKYKKSIRYYDTAIKLDTNNPQIHWNLSHVLLLLQKYKRGFKEYEYRYKLDISNIKQISDYYQIPLYTNQNLINKNLLIHPEDGFGDNIQMIRYIDKLYDIGIKKIYVVALDEQKRLFQTIKNIQVIDISSVKDMDDIDYFTTFMSLPYICKSTLQTIPKKIPYIKIKEKREFDFIRKNSKLKVGVAWEASKNNQNIINRSIDINIFKKLFDIKEIDFYSLQLGEDTTTLSRDYSNFIDCSSYISDFYDTALIIKNLDLVITIDSAIAHLSASIDKETWIGILRYADWRWTVNNKNKPFWYSNVRIFRQNELNDFNSVIKDITKQLIKIVQEKE